MTHTARVRDNGACPPALAARGLVRHEALHVHRFSARALVDVRQISVIGS